MQNKRTLGTTTEEWKMKQKFIHFYRFVVIVLLVAVVVMYYVLYAELLEQ